MAEQDSKDSYHPTRVTLTVKATTIRDGTRGISLSIAGQLIGEWTDSKSRMLSLTDDYKARIHGRDGEPLYLLSVPGKPLSGEQVSDKEVAITFEI